MKLLKISICTILLLATFFSCSDTIPKPRGYFRIELADKEYTNYTNDSVPYQFQYPSNVSTIQLKAIHPDSVGFNIYYPQHNAKIYCTYLTLHNNFQNIAEDTRRLVYKPHTVKADAITEQVYQNDEHKVYGILYELKGNTASNIQFVMSDSTKHFLRGALYFNANPNKDSIAPVVNYIREDIIQLIETLEWK